MTNLFDVPEVLVALEAAVAERGADYVYDYGSTPSGNCVYVGSDGTPSCIVGVALSKLGVSVETLKAEGQTGAAGGRTPFNAIAIGSRSDLAALLTPAAVNVLAAAQFRQDSGESWGEALNAARRAAGGASYA